MKKKSVKKILSFILSAVMAAGLLAGCGSKESSSSAADTADTEKIQVVASIFPEYDWVMNILGDKAENFNVSMLLDNGVDLHSYQPSVDDIIKISTCDLFIYVGGVSDAWVDSALEEAVNEDMVVVNLMDILGEGAKEEEVIEGMEAEKEEDAEYDEHVWLSVKNASLFVDAISQALESLDSTNAAAYEANASNYIEKLSALDENYQAVVDKAKVKTLLFGDRFPFRYMVDDYGLKYYAAFAGCSAESEASFETIAFLAGKVDELNLSTVLALEGSDKKIAEAIVSAAEKEDVQILLMDSMQQTTSKDIEDGVTYLSIMEKNLQVLESALK